MPVDISDILIHVSAGLPIKDTFIKNGEFLKSADGNPFHCVGGFTVVFPVVVNAEKYAFRCWFILPDSQSRFRIISDGLASRKLPYFEDFTYVEKGLFVNGHIYPTTRMKWIEGLNLKDYLVGKINDSNALCLLAKRFCEMVQDMHGRNIAHGDLQHENIVVDSSGHLHLIDYDSLYLPEMSSLKFPDDITGKPDYQHPRRKTNRYSSEKLDYFSELVILISILGVAKSPSLAAKYKMADSDSLLFTQNDFKDLKSSMIYRDLTALGGIFVPLLNILSKYLSADDINSLNPLESELKDYGYSVNGVINKVRMSGLESVISGKESVLVATALVLIISVLAIPPIIRYTSSSKSHSSSSERHSSSSDETAFLTIDRNLIEGNYTLTGLDGTITSASIEFVRDNIFNLTIYSKFRPFRDSLSISNGIVESSTDGPGKIAYDNKSQCLTITMNKYILTKYQNITD